MRVRCIKNNIFDVSDENSVERLQKYVRLPDGQLNLDLDTDYTVYGVLFRDNSPWYYLCLDEDDEYPKPFASELFEVLDSKLSELWSLSSNSMTSKKIISEIVFSEWSGDSMFYERLVDGDPKAIEVFQKCRILMDKEHAL